MTSKFKSSPPRFGILFLCILAAFSSACNRGSSQTAKNSSTKHYSFKGKVASMDKPAAMANIENEAIAGFMEPMVMPYTIKPAAMLDQLQPGDSITADLYVQPDNSYWLENVKVIGHSKSASEKPAAMHIPAPGDAVPNFKLVNQSGKQISLDEHRGETLVLTMIYTRCPFPDFCPRVSHEFAAIDRELRANPVRFGRTHLLSISFDPAYDTPKVLREYGFACAGSKNPALFTHWEFSAVPAAELPDVANYFALTYKEEGGLITHSLSTAVISPDGKIFKWYHGADWQAADLLQDIAAAHAAS
jgi:protein SCO1/2